MQATSSQVTEPTTSTFSTDLLNGPLHDEPGDQIFIDLTKAAASAKRSHILVRRRKRSTRRASH